MIEVFTTTQIEATGFDRDYVTRKRVVMTMDADDALVLYTLLVNAQEVHNMTPEWRRALMRVSDSLLDSGNKCR
jgi:hypothetical protein